MTRQEDFNARRARQAVEAARERFFEEIIEEARLESEGKAALVPVRLSEMPPEEGSGEQKGDRQKKDRQNTNGFPSGVSQTHAGRRRSDRAALEHLEAQGAAAFSSGAGSARPSRADRQASSDEAWIRRIAMDYVAARECTAMMLKKYLTTKAGRRLAARQAPKAPQEPKTRRASSLSRSAPNEGAAPYRRKAALGPVALDEAMAALIAREIARLVERRYVDDQRYAAMKTRSGLASGRGARRIRADLARKGVSQDVLDAGLAEGVERFVEEATPRAAGAGPDHGGVAQEGIDPEFAAALTLARRKRLGPWRKERPSGDRMAWMKVLNRELGAFARSGFSHGVARRAMEAEDDILAELGFDPPDRNADGDLERIDVDDAWAASGID